MKHFPTLSAPDQWEFFRSNNVADIYKYTNNRIPHTIELLVVDWGNHGYIIRLQSDSCEEPVEQTETQFKQLAVAEANRLMNEADSVLCKNKTTQFVDTYPTR